MIQLIIGATLPLTHKFLLKYAQKPHMHKPHTRGHGLQKKQNNKKIYEHEISASTYIHGETFAVVTKLQNLEGFPTETFLVTEIQYELFTPNRHLHVFLIQKTYHLYLAI